ncbi:MAG: hypothetical protein V7707_12790 [Motiliproteus sp.]
MLGIQNNISTDRYARCVETSKRISWDIDDDVIRGRSLDSTRKFLPDGLSGVTLLDFLSPDDSRLLSQIQGRTYANMFGLVERFINTKIVELREHHRPANAVEFEALARFSEEEIKHQKLFRRIDQLASEIMPSGYRFVADPDEVAAAVLSKSTWAVLGLTCVIELFTQAHYRHSIDRDADICPLYKDVFLFHWKEESQHAILDEIEWRQHDTRLAFPSRDAAVTDLIDLVVAVDGILQAQAASDTRYFLAVCGQSFDEESQAELAEVMLEAYRYQYILSGASLPHFQGILADLVLPQQLERIVGALQTLQPVNPSHHWGRAANN